MRSALLHCCPQRETLGAGRRARSCRLRAPAPSCAQRRALSCQLQLRVHTTLHPAQPVRAASPVSPQHRVLARSLSPGGLGQAGLLAQLRPSPTAPESWAPAGLPGMLLQPALWVGPSSSAPPPCGRRDVSAAGAVLCVAGRLADPCPYPLNATTPLSCDNQICLGILQILPGTKLSPVEGQLHSDRPQPTPSLVSGLVSGHSPGETEGDRHLRNEANK